jgi:hypothetical protein
MKRVHKAALFGDFLDGKSGMGKQLGGGFQPFGIELLRGGGDSLHAAELEQVLARYSGFLRHFLQGEMSAVFPADNGLQARQGLVSRRLAQRMLVGSQGEISHQRQAQPQAEFILQEFLGIHVRAAPGEQGDHAPDKRNGSLQGLQTLSQLQRNNAGPNRAPAMPRFPCFAENKMFPVVRVEQDGLSGSDMDGSFVHLQIQAAGVHRHELKVPLHPGAADAARGVNDLAKDHRSAVEAIHPGYILESFSHSLAAVIAYHGYLDNHVCRGRPENHLVKKLPFIAGVLLAVTPFSALHADSITGAITSAPGNIDLNDYNGFAYYANTSLSLYIPTTGTPSTDTSNVGKFSVLTSIGGSGIHTSGTSPATVTYSGATSPAPSETNAKGFYYNMNGGVGIGFSLTSTLFASTETFQFLLQDYNTTSNLTASLNDVGSTSFSLSNQILTNWYGGVATGAGNTDGVLTVTVQGTVGQILTFKDVEGSTGLGSNGNVGIEAATVEEVPEPSAWAMMGLGSLLFAWLLRRGRLAAWR